MYAYEIVRWSYPGMQPSPRPRAPLHEPSWNPRRVAARIRRRADARQSRAALAEPARAVAAAATAPTHWRFATIRPLLLRAGELTPIEKAERRVLVLANPGRGLANLQASA